MATPQFGLFGRVRNSGSSGSGTVSVSVVSVPSLGIVSTGLRSFGNDIKSFREPLKLAIQGIAAPSIRQNFELGGRPPWAPLADETIRIKTAKGYKRPTDPLIATGKLMRVAGQLNIWTITREEAMVTQLPGAEYGRFHQTGTIHMPKREFLTLQPSDIDEIEEVFDNWILRRMIARGLF